MELTASSTFLRAATSGVATAGAAEAEALAGAALDIEKGREGAKKGLVNVSDTRGH
jgi:hypothetical protein